jgi:translation initiation factor 2 alpha subunit (eIF-2alpha)
MISIVGQGYVGLPLSLAIASSGFKVCGIEIDEVKSNELNDGETKIEGIELNLLKSLIKSQNLCFSQEFDNISNSDVILICVPTPLDQNNKPDLRALTSATRKIGEKLMTLCSNFILSYKRESSVIFVSAPELKKFQHEHYDVEICGMQGSNDLESIHSKIQIFLNYSDATRKRSVSSWKKIVPLNVPTIAKVENNDSNIIQVSLSFLSENTNNKENMEQFNKNNQLIKIFKKLSIIENKDMTELWKSIIYPIDKHRREEYEVKDIPCLLDYCNNEQGFIESIFKESIYYDIYPKFIELLDNLSKEKPYRIISKIDIVSPGGIQNTKEILTKAIQTINFNYSLVYDTAPTFKFESNSIESSDDDHKNFIKFLEIEGQKLNPKTFIRCNSIVHV